MRGNDEALQQLLVFPATDIEVDILMFFANFFSIFFVKVGDEQDVSPLHLACTYGHLETVRWERRREKKHPEIIRPDICQDDN